MTVDETPKTDALEHRIEGNEAQILTCVLRQGQRMRSSPGAMIYMSTHMEMETSMGGGFMKGCCRCLSGGTMFISDFFYTGPPTECGKVTFGTDFPSKIIHISMAEHNNSIVCQQGSFICSTASVEINMRMVRKCGMACFGGEGVILQHLTGPGDAFIQSYGASIERYLSEGEELSVSTGSIVAFDDTVKYDIKRIKGCFNCCCGGEGMFLTVLTGPGKVYLQGIQLANIIKKLNPKAK